MMIDAFRAETFRLSRNRMTLFWSVVFVPVLGLLLTVAGNMFLKQRMGEITDARLPPGMLQGGELHLGAALISASSDLAGAMVLLFVLIGLATLFAGDYRWETWRLIRARDTRPALILGKVSAGKLLVIVALSAALVSALTGEFLKAVIFERPISMTVSGGEAGDFGLLLLVAYLRAIQVAMLALLAAVATRSLLAAMIAPLAITIGQFFLMQTMPVLGWTPEQWAPQLLIPGLAADSLKAAIAGGMGAPSSAVVWKAVLSLALWILGPLAAAIALFERQDLSKE